jgi:hypothetical protein
MEQSAFRPEDLRGLIVAVPGSDHGQAQFLASLPVDAQDLTHAPLT